MRPFLAPLLVPSTVLLAQTDNRVRRSISVQATGRLALNAELGSIRVQPGTATAVNFEVEFRGNPPSRQDFDKMIKNFTLDVVQTGGDVRVEGRFRGGWVERSLFDAGGWHYCRNGRCLEYTWLRGVEFNVTVPAGFSLEANTTGGSITVGDLKGEVRVRTSGGSLDLGRIDGSVDGHTSGGSITLRGGKGRATVHTSGGSIRIDEVAGDVDAETSGGSISVERSTGRVTAHTSGGGITVREAAGPWDVSTSGGSIEVALPANQGYDIDASTSGGSVSSDLPVLTSGERHRRHLRGPVNGGGTPVRLRTSGGGIRIRRS
jgi:hypothetical protein